MKAQGTARDSLLAAIDRMGGSRVLVVADLVLDEFEYGEIDRVSREAPVLILAHRGTVRLPGGGANAVHNLAALDGKPLVVGRVGGDEAGDQLLSLLNERGADTTRVWRDPGYATPVKRRVLAGSAHSVRQQIVRIDRGGGPAVKAQGSPLLPAVREAVATAQGTLLSDYSLGLLNGDTIGAVTEAVRAIRAGTRRTCDRSSGRSFASTSTTAAACCTTAALGPIPSTTRPPRATRSGITACATHGGSRSIASPVTCCHHEPVSSSFMMKFWLLMPAR